MRYANFREFPKTSIVRSAARRLAHSYQVLFHICIPRLDLLPCIHDSPILDSILLSRTSKSRMSF